MDRDDERIVRAGRSDSGVPANNDSLRFHIAVGFEEVKRIICFKKASEYAARMEADAVVGAGLHGT